MTNKGDDDGGPSKKQEEGGGGGVGGCPVSLVWILKGLVSVFHVAVGN